MAGYDGYSMSNNAVQAYKDGEMPKSKWTKDIIIESIEEKVEDGELVLKCSFSKLKKLPAKVLQVICLCYASWHHTSQCYNHTDFYLLDIDWIGKLTDDDLEQLALDYKEEQKAIKKKKEEEVPETWECRYYEWSGSRRHPKKEEFEKVGIIKGNWFYPFDGDKKKKVDGKHFSKIRKLSEEEVKMLKAKEEEDRILKIEQKKEEALKNRKKLLYRYQTEFKTLSGFLRSDRVDSEYLEKLEKERKMMLDEKREWLRPIWERKNHTKGLAMLDDDSFVENHINVSDFRFAGLNRKKESNQYQTMNRVSVDGKKIVVKVGSSHIIATREGGYALILDATHVVFLEDWQVSQSRYGTEVLLEKKSFKVKKWGKFEDFCDMPKNLDFKTWLETAKLQDAAADEAGVKLNSVKWRYRQT